MRTPCSGEPSSQEPFAGVRAHARPPVRINYPLLLADPLRRHLPKKTRCHSETCSKSGTNSPTRIARPRAAIATAIAVPHHHYHHRGYRPRSQNSNFYARRRRRKRRLNRPASLVILCATTNRCCRPICTVDLGDSRVRAARGQRVLARVQGGSKAFPGTKGPAMQARIPTAKASWQSGYTLVAGGRQAASMCRTICLMWVVTEWRGPRRKKQNGRRGRRCW